MAFEQALTRAKEVFQEAETFGFKLSLLDIGGGFQTSGFEEIASAIQQAIAREFSSHVRVIAEPGRLYARPVYTVAAKVISRRQGLHKSLPDALYQSDGVYGSFMNVLLEEEVVQPKLLSMTDPLKGADHSASMSEHKYIVWGPTCCGMDCVVREATFDREVHIGDWLAYDNMGGEFSKYVLELFF
jgi:ornithine decarboxylase